VGTHVEFQLQLSPVVLVRDTRLEVISEYMCCINIAHCTSMLMWCSIVSVLTSTFSFNFLFICLGLKMSQLPFKHKISAMIY